MDFPNAVSRDVHSYALQKSSLLIDDITLRMCQLFEDAPSSTMSDLFLNSGVNISKRKTL